MGNIFEPWPEFFPQFLPGLLVTLQLTLAAITFGLIGGIVLAVLASAPNRLIRWVVVAVIELARGTPGLLVLYIVYFGLPQFDIALQSMPAAVIALSFTTSGYASEIIRAGMRAVDTGQKEAAQALAMTPSQEMRLIVLPQALRKVIPPLIGLAILVYQGTSLAYAIAVPELLSRAYNIATITYQFASALVLAGVMYAVISLTITLLVNGRGANQ